MNALKVHFLKIIFYYDIHLNNHKDVFSYLVLSHQLGIEAEDHLFLILNHSKFLMLLIFYIF
jgi:hypothetical protein